MLTVCLAIEGSEIMYAIHIANLVGAVQVCLLLGTRHACSFGDC